MMEWLSGLLLDKVGIATCVVAVGWVLDPG